MSFRITHIYLFVSVDKDDVEGVIGARAGDVMMPFVAADEKRLIDLIPQAERIAKLNGLTYRIVSFGNREDVTEEVKKKYLP